MNRAASTVLVSIISSLITLFVVHKWNLPQITYSLPPSRALRQIPQPRHYSRAPLPATARPFNHPPVSVPARPFSRPPVSVPSRPFLPAVQRPTDCSQDIFACGTGFYCCSGQCVKAVYVRLEFVADDRGDLYVCQQSEYARVAHTDVFDQVGTIVDWMPCTATYLTVRNPTLEGGATIFIQEQSSGLTGESGTSTLPIDSEPDFNTQFKPAVRFTAIYNTFPYSDYIRNHGAYPVTDPVNSRARNISLRFIPTGC